VQTSDSDCDGDDRADTTARVVDFAESASENETVTGETLIVLEKPSLSIIP